LRVKNTVEEMAECANATLLLRPALLRGLNCMGSTSLKGASLAGATPMILASSGNFKRLRALAETCSLRLCADAKACRRHGGRMAQLAGRAGKFHEFAIEPPPTCRNGSYTRRHRHSARSNPSLGSSPPSPPEIFSPWTGPFCVAHPTSQSITRRHPVRQRPRRRRGASAGRRARNRGRHGPAGPRQPCAR